MQSINTQTEYLTIREAAEMSGLSASYIRSWTASGKLICDRSSGLIMVEVDCLRLLLRTRASRRRRPRLRLVVSNPNL